MGFDVAVFLSDVPLFVLAVIVLSYYLLRDYQFNDQD
jgi:hypothetical protein